MVDGFTSQEAPVQSGVPQGTVLGLLMFLVHINDIIKNISGQMRLFADDALLYNQINSDDDAASLQHDLNTLDKWAHMWKMAFNTNKCHVLRVTRNRKVKNHIYKLGETTLSSVKHHPYLGVEIDDKLGWKEQIDNVRSKGTRMLNMVRRNFTRGTTPAIRSQVYVSLVRPSMEYGSIVWDPHQQTRIVMLEGVQNKAARYVHQDWSRHTSVTALKNNVGWCTLQERRLVNRLTFMSKTVCGHHKYTMPPYIVKPVRRMKSHHTYSFQNLRSRTDAYAYSFLPRTVRGWNQLPEEIASQSKPATFRTKLVKAIKDKKLILAPSGSASVQPQPGPHTWIF